MQSEDWPTNNVARTRACGGLHKRALKLYRMGFLRGTVETTVKVRICSERRDSAVGSWRPKARGVNLPPPRMPPAAQGLALP